MLNRTVKRYKVIVLTSTFPRWKNDSQPAFVFELCRRLGTSYDITVLAPRSRDSKTIEIIDGLRVIRYPYFFNRWENLATHGGGILNRLHYNPLNYLLVPLFLSGQLFSIVRALQKERYDLIHAHWLIPQGIIASMGIVLANVQIPLVCTSHGGDLFALQGRVFRCLRKWAIKRSKSLTVVSNAMKSIVLKEGAFPDKVRVISMGVDLKHQFKPDLTIKRSTSDLLFVGRLVEKKGVKTLIEAMPTIIAKYPEAHLLIAGSGPLEGALQKLARRLNLSDQVKFIGMVPQTKLSALYQQASLAIFPFMVARNGDQEGFGLVQVEAMGCGCPVVSGDLPAIHDIIEDQKNGLLVKSGDVDALAKVIIKALDDTNLRLRLAEAARSKVLEMYDWDIIADKYSRLYQNIIRGS